MENKLDAQLKIILDTASKHFKSKGYKIETTKTSSLYNKLYTKDDIVYSIGFWKKSKYTYPALIDVLRSENNNIEEIFHADVIGTMGEHYESIEKNLLLILENIKSQK